jgi:hypothetical protein
MPSLAKATAVARPMPVKPPVIKTTDVFMDHSSCFSLSDTQGMAVETGEPTSRHGFLRWTASVAAQIGSPGAGEKDFV